MPVVYKRLFWQMVRQKRFCQVKTKMKEERDLWREPNRHRNGAGREEDALRFSYPTSLHRDQRPL